MKYWGCNMQLRPYQLQGIESLRAAFRGGAKSVVLVSPTGSGKTVVSSEVMRASSERNNEVLFLAHRIELIKQTCDKLATFGLEHKIYASDADTKMIRVAQTKKYGKSKINPFAKIAVGTVQTVSRRLDKIAEPSLIIIDETHLAIANTYQMIIERFPKARIVGLTATPCRLDGRGLGEMYESLSVLADPQDIANMGFLVPMRIFSASTTVNLSNVKIKMGDFDKKQLAEEMEKPRLIGDAVEHYRKLAHKRPAIAFCVSIKHAEMTAQAFRDAGYKATAVSGKSTSEEREKAIDGLATGEWDVVCNCGLYIEGLDQPCISCVILLAPTKSLSRYLQSVGRGSRPAEGKKDCIVLDHAGNVLQHGMPYEQREWSLDGAKKRGKRDKSDEQDVNVTTCKECFAIFEKELSVCPNCGALKPVATGRVIEHEEGELVEIDESIFKKKKKEEVRNARTLEELIALGKSRGYRFPVGWANKQLEIRNKYAKS